MSKYLEGGNTHICKECGRPLGLRTPIWWRSHKLCSTRCKKLYSTRWWRDWRERWLARIYTRHT
jgi:hypothetical protein